jgi:hypothetical protein
VSCRRPLQTLPAEVIDDAQDAELATAHKRVADNIKRPPLVRTLGNRQRSPGAKGAFAGSMLANHKPLHLLEPMELLPVDLNTLTAAVR